MFLNMLCWHEFWLKQCDHYVMSWVFIYDNCWRCLQRVGGTGAVKHISGLQTAQFNTAPIYQLCMYLCWGREIIKLELDNLYSNHYARKELWSTRSPQHVSLPPVLLEPYLSVRAFHTTLKKDPVEGYKDGRSNGKVTAVDGTIAWSLGAGVRNRVRWGLSYYCLHQKDGQRIFLRRTHSQRHKHTTHTQPHAHPIVHIFFFFFGVGVSLNKGHQSSSLGVFTLVLQRSTTPHLTASSACSHRASLKASKAGTSVERGTEWPSLHQAPCASCRTRHAHSTRNHYEWGT